MRRFIGWLGLALLAYLALNCVALGHLEYALGWPIPTSSDGRYTGAYSGQGLDR